MEISHFIQSFIVLLILLAILLFFLFFSKKAKQKRKASRVSKATEAIPSLKSLRDNIKDKQISTRELEANVQLILLHYVKIEVFDIYEEILFRITRHPSTHTKLILSFERELCKCNPEHASRIASSIMQGLDSR